MLNLIKMNLYRVVHTKCTWILLMITAAMCVLGVYLSYADQNVQEFEGGKTEQIRILDAVCAEMQGGYVLIFLCIFVVLYFHGEEASGFIKNLAGRAGVRWQMYFAKYAAVLVYILLSLLVQIAVTVVSFIAMVSDVAMDFSLLREFCSISWPAERGSVCLYLGVLLVLEMAFAGGVAFLVTLTRNSVISMAVSILLAVGMGWMITDLLVSRLTWLPENLAKYQVVCQAGALFYDSGSKALTFGMLVGAVWLIVYSVLGGILTEKRDMI